MAQNTRAKIKGNRIEAMKAFTINMFFSKRAAVKVYKIASVRPKWSKRGEDAESMWIPSQLDHEQGRSLCHGSRTERWSNFVGTVY